MPGFLVGGARGALELGDLCPEDLLHKVWRPHVGIFRGRSGNQFWHPTACYYSIEGFRQKQQWVVDSVLIMFFCWRGIGSFCLVRHFARKLRKKDLRCLEGNYQTTRVCNRIGQLNPLFTMIYKTHTHVNQHPFGCPQIKLTVQSS